MSDKINIYCDESCHLENDGSPVMVIGGVWLPKNTVKKVCNEIRDIKERHGFSRNFEFKWSQISPSKIAFYKELIAYFFQNDSLHYRGVIASKTNLDMPGHDHDDWYYKMYYLMLINIINTQNTYNIYIDIKENKRGGIKSQKLHRILSRKQHDFDFRIIKRLQIIKSSDSEILQLSDLFSGALCYLNRRLEGGTAKPEIISYISELSKCNLSVSSLPSESKFNRFYWKKEC